MQPRGPPHSDGPSRKSVPPRSAKSWPYHVDFGYILLNDNRYLPSRIDSGREKLSEVRVDDRLNPNRCGDARDGSVTEASCGMQGDAGLR